MESRVKVLGHPIHPMLIVFPLGLLATGVIFDVLYMLLDNVNFSIAAFWMITAGLLGGLLAAIFGFLDWLAIPANTRAKSIGLWHGIGNLVIMVLFAWSWFLRLDVPDYVPGMFPLILELVGSGLALITGWLGGELVYRLGMAVDPGANLNAPSSLSEKPAAETTRHERR